MGRGKSGDWGTPSLCHTHTLYVGTCSLSHLWVLAHFGKQREQNIHGTGVAIQGGGGLKIVGNFRSIDPRF